MKKFIYKTKLLFKYAQALWLYRRLGIPADSRQLAAAIKAGLGPTRDSLAAIALMPDMIKAYRQVIDDCGLPFKDVRYSVSLAFHAMITKLPLTENGAPQIYQTMNLVRMVSMHRDALALTLVEQGVTADKYLELRQKYAELDEVIAKRAEQLIGRKLDRSDANSPVQQAALLCLAGESHEKVMQGLIHQLWGPPQTTTQLEA